MLDIKQGLKYIVIAAGLSVAALGCNSDRNDTREGGIIRIDSGLSQYEDCNERTLVDILSDERHCGGCDITCDPGAYCREGLCEIPMFDAGVDCDLTQIEMDRYNCGACGVECRPVQGCRGGECLYAEYYEDDNVCSVDADCEGELECRTPMGWPIDYCMELPGCEFDDDCIEENNYCLVGDCTLVIPEECNGEDDNRNGQVDEGLVMGSCYPAAFDPATEGIGSCRAGTNLCVDGGWDICIGYAGPIAEVGIFACDGVDNDCDGCPDNTYDEEGICIPPEPRLFDIVMMVDTSSSRRYEIAATTEAIYLIGEAVASSPNIWFSLLTFTYPLTDPDTGVRDPDTMIDGRIYQGDPNRSVVQSLAPFPTFATALSMVTLTGFGDEQSYDVAYLAANEDLPSLRFRPGATRIFIMFTDEEGASYAVEPHTAESMCAPYDARPQDVLGAVTPDIYQPGWPCADIRRRTTDDPAVIAQDILDILDLGCE